MAQSESFERDNYDPSYYQTSSPDPRLADTSGKAKVDEMPRGQSSRTRTSSLTQSEYGATGNTPATIVRPHHAAHGLGYVRSISSPTGSSKGTSELESSLVSLASRTMKRLQHIWDEIGSEQEERDLQLKHLCSRLQELCDNKIEEEQTVADQYRKSIKDLREEMSDLCSSLQLQAPDPTLMSESYNLTEEFQSLEATLDNLRNLAAQARQDLHSVRDELTTLYEALDGVRPAENSRWWMDIKSDLTDQKRIQFHNHLSEMVSMVESRSSTVVNMILDCQYLLKELNIPRSKFVGGSNSNDGNGTVISMTDLDEKVLHSLIRVSTDESPDDSVKGSKDRASRYKLKSIKETESCTGISSMALEKLTDRLTELNAEKQRRKKRLAELGNEIALLWEKLRVSADEQAAFIQTVEGLSLDTIDRGEKEVKRLHKLKGQMMGRLIAEAREIIIDLWEETNAGVKQKQAFIPMQIHDETKFTDELLQQHENYIKDLRLRLDTMQPILRTIARREDILEQRMQLEEFQKDPTRLQQRGAKLTQQLMKEEKMAKRIKKDLPKLTLALEKDCQQWKAEKNEDFLYHGEIYLEVMQRQEQEWQDYKNGAANEKMAKKQKERTDENTQPRGSYLKQNTATNQTSRPLSTASSKDHVNNGSFNSKGNTERSVSRQHERSSSRGKSRPKSRGKTRTEVDSR